MRARRQYVLRWLRSAGGVCLLAAACSAGKPEQPPSGGLTLQLQPSDAVVLQSLRYTLSREHFSRSGLLSVDAMQSTSLLDLQSVPVGTYTLALDAEATRIADGSQTQCSSMSGFEISADQTTALSMRLHCDGDAADGSSSEQDAAVGACPTINGIVALPATAPVGREVELQASVLDPADIPQPLHYTWSAPTGRLQTPSLESVEFWCTEPGVVKVRLAISSGDSACADDAFVYVTCDRADCAATAQGCSASASGASAAGGTGAAFDQNALGHGVAAGAGGMESAGQGGDSATGTIAMRVPVTTVVSAGAGGGASRAVQSASVAGMMGSAVDQAGTGAVVAAAGDARGAPSSTDQRSSHGPDTNEPQTAGVGGELGGAAATGATQPTADSGSSSTTEPAGGQAGSGGAGGSSTALGNPADEGAEGRAGAEGGRRRRRDQAGGQAGDEGSIDGEDQGGGQAGARERGRNHGRGRWGL